MVVNKYNSSISNDPSVYEKHLEFNPELKSILFEDLDMLHRIWPMLSNKDKLLLEGRYIWGYNDSELAEQLKTNPQNIRTYLSRAKKRALKLMEKELSRDDGP